MGDIYNQSKPVVTIYQNGNQRQDWRQATYILQTPSSIHSGLTLDEVEATLESFYKPVIRFNGSVCRTARGHIWALVAGLSR